MVKLHINPNTTASQHTCALQSVPPVPICPSSAPQPAQATAGEAICKVSLPEQRCAEWHLEHAKPGKLKHTAPQLNEL